MKYSSFIRLLIAFTIIFALAGVGMASCEGGGIEKESEYTNNDDPKPDPKPDEEDPPSSGQAIPLADPFILLYDGTFYAYGTGGFMGFEVATSQTLNIWKRRQGNNERGMALHKKDTPLAGVESPRL